MKQVARLSQDQEVVVGSSLAVFFIIEDDNRYNSVTGRSGFRNIALYGDH